MCICVVMVPEFLTPYIQVKKKKERKDVPGAHTVKGPRGVRPLRL